jgi:hypothetical protein
MSNETFQAFSGMSFLTLEQLPFVGMSYEFVGEKQGAPFSAYIVTAKPGQGPPLHTHPYVEVTFILEGCGESVGAGFSQTPAPIQRFHLPLLASLSSVELETLRFARLHKHHAGIFAEHLTPILLRR